MQLVHVKYGALEQLCLILPENHREFKPSAGGRSVPYMSVCNTGRQKSVFKNRAQYMPAASRLAYVEDPLYALDWPTGESLAVASQAGCRRFDPGLPLQVLFDALISSATLHLEGNFSVIAGMRGSSFPASRLLVVGQEELSNESEYPIRKVCPTAYRMPG
jgi:hypothetical protein